MELSEKLRDNFDEMVVFKDLKKTNFFSTLSLPAFMRDWLLKKFEDEDGNFDKDDLARFVKKFIPRKDDWNAIKNDIIQVISKYMDIDTEALNIQITQTESESNNGTVPALFANIPIKDMKHRSER